MTLIKVDKLFQSLPLSRFEREGERGLSWFKLGIDLVKCVPVGLCRKTSVSPQGDDTTKAQNNSLGYK